MNLSESIINMLSEAGKIACLKCDEVSTEAAWKKNDGVCPKCNRSENGVAESTGITEDHFKKGDKVTIKNAKSYDALRPNEVSGVVQTSMMNKGTEYYTVKVGTGQMTVKASDLIAEAKPSLEDTFNKIKDWDAKALAGYGRKVGLDDEVINPIKRDKESLLSEILSHLFGDDVEIELMNKGLI